MIHNRQTGITTALAKACIENDGVLVCMDQMHADMVKKQFKCRTMSLATSYTVKDKELFVLYDNATLWKIDAPNRSIRPASNSFEHPQGSL